MLDEKALRRDTFQEGTPIRLWDGQEWTLPKPQLAGWSARRVKEGTIKMLRSSRFGPDYDALRDAYLDSDDNFESLETLAAAVAWLLIYNYNIPDEALAELLHYPMSDDPRYAEAETMWTALSELVAGRAPKPTPAGSA